MNPYAISPEVSTVSVDPALSAEFAHLNTTLDWRPLATNLESCESPPYLYFRIFLTARSNNNTYAGFATGAPFILTRDVDKDKRAFFLRHWVRHEPPPSNLLPPHRPLPHMALATNDRILLVRIDIDRPLIPADTFRSVPFATTMFQIAHVDALITQLPSIRFAFAIERTITAEEREVVNAAGLPLPPKGPRSTPVTSQPSSVHLPSTASRPRPLHPSAPSLAHTGTGTVPRAARPVLGPPPSHTIAPAHVAPAPAPMPVAPRPPMAYKTLNPRPAGTAGQTHMYYGGGGRQVPIQARQQQQLAARPAHIAMSHQQHMQKMPTKTHARQSGGGGGHAGGAAGGAAGDARPVLHPYLKMWEDRDLDDPYEPIFVTEDPKFDAVAKKSWVVEEEAEEGRRFEYHELFGVPTADYPPFHFEGPRVGEEDAEPDAEVLVQRRHKKVQVETSQVSGGSAEEEAGIPSDAATIYSEAVVAAAEYNSLLRKDRGVLSKWLVEDQSRGEDDSDDDDDDDNDDGDSSD